MNRLGRTEKRDPMRRASRMEKNPWLRCVLLGSLLPACAAEAALSREPGGSSSTQTSPQPSAQPPTPQQPPTAQPQQDETYPKPQGNPWPPVEIQRLEPDLMLKGTPDEQLPPQLRRDYAYPDIRLPWGYPQGGGPSSRYRYGNRPYGSYGDRPLRSYDYGYSDYYRYSHPYGPLGYDFDYYGGPNYGYGYADPYSRGDELAEAYRFGVDHGRRFAQFERQAELGLKSYLDAMEWGQAAFTKADYAEASRHFLGAARLNQGDPASRLCAAHALIALGQMGEAAKLIERAFELQPGLAHLSLNLATDFASPEEFERQAAAARDYTSTHPGSAAGWAVHGYLCYFTGRLSEAAAAFQKARALDDQDPFIRQMCDITKYYLGAS